MLRSLFAAMIILCGLGDARQSWGEYKENFPEDVLLQVHHHSSNQNVLLDDAIVNQTLVLLEDKVLEIGGQLLNKYGLPTRTPRSAPAYTQTHAS
jgi:hypothetical protein